MISTTSSTAAAVNTLAPYAGEWGRTQAAHLLRRATFAPSKVEIDQAVSLGFDASIDKLFVDLPLPEDPIYYDYDGHPELSLGDKWNGAYLNPDDRNNDNNARNRSTMAWHVLNAADTGFNVREKMVLFWNNHFGIGGVGLHSARVRTFTLYRKYATGNFRDLVKEITIEPYMLRFLNGADNTGRNPNENFAREILELYTIGKGPQTMPGDYTNYTEKDVTELARAFTGWRVFDANTSDPDGRERSEFVPNRHDTGQKVLSYRFDNAVIKNADEQEYANVVDLIFTKDEVARYICRKLYRHFVYFEITPQVESTIIGEMARLVIDNDYVVEPALRALFKSEHFYRATFIGSMIKTPLDFVMSLVRNTKFLDQPERINKFRAALRCFGHLRDTGMDLNQLPTVAGWTAYYQIPSFHKLWLNTTTIQNRTRFSDRCTRRAHYWNGGRYDVNWLPVIDALNDPFDATTMINDLAELLLPRPLASTQFDYLYELLLDGQEDFVWTNEYADYISNPGDEMSRKAINDRLDAMIFGLTELAEFQVH